jgi:2,4-dienoyl-CoA reductase-like NADH-dependent reductase (Old Yellow Enzyme family)
VLEEAVEIVVEAVAKEVDEAVDSDMIVTVRLSELSYKLGLK